MRFVCVTDDPEGLGDFIDVQPFPDWGDWYETMKKGCRLKLSIFVPAPEAGSADRILILTR